MKTLVALAAAAAFALPAFAQDKAAPSEARDDAKAPAKDARKRHPERERQGNYGGGHRVHHGKQERQEPQKTETK